MHPLARRAFAGAAASAVGLGIGQAMPFPYAHWAAVTALKLASPAAEGTLRKTVLRVLGTALSAVGVIALYGYADPRPEVLLSASLTGFWIGFFLMPLTKYSYAVLLFLPFGSCFILEAMEAPLSAPSLVGYRVFFVVLGSILVLIFARLAGVRDPFSEPGDRPRMLDAAIHASRVTLAAGLCIAFAALVERPGLASMMVISVMVLGTRTNATESRGLGEMRLGGALLGGLISLGYYVFLVNVSSSVWGLMAFAFAVLWLCVLMIGVSQLSYMGFQTGLVFAWSVADSRAPEPDVWIPITRTFQVACASVILLLIYRIRMPSRLALHSGWR